MQLANGISPQHTALQSPGWWRQDSRLTIPPPTDAFTDLSNIVFTGQAGYQRENTLSQLK
jgi:hypothetical protein